MTTYVYNGDCGLHKNENSIILLHVNKVLIFWTNTTHRSCTTVFYFTL